MEELGKTNWETVIAPPTSLLARWAGCLWGRILEYRLLGEERQATRRDAHPLQALGYPSRVFTGLIQALGRVVAFGPHFPATSSGVTRLEIDLCGWAYRPELGASIAVNGCCLTVAALDGAGKIAAFDLMAQTLAVTGLGALRVGDAVNLEHAATPTTFLGGHVVLGHVDGLGEVVGLEKDGQWRLRVRLPSDLGMHAVDKGSITLDGVSLTIARVEDQRGAGARDGCVIDVCLIPETLARTNLGARVVGDRLHIEADYLAKLVARQIAWATQQRG